MTEVRKNKSAPQEGAKKRTNGEGTAGASRGMKPKDSSVSKTDKKNSKLAKAEKDKTKKAARAVAEKDKVKKNKEKETKKKAEKQARDKAKLAKKASEKARKLTKEKIKKHDKNTSKIVYESRMQRLEAVNYFDALISGLKKGSVQFKQGDETVVVTPSELDAVEIVAKTKGRKERVTFELSWISEKASDISISSK